MANTRMMIRSITFSGGFANVTGTITGVGGRSLNIDGSIERGTPCGGTLRVFKVAGIVGRNLAIKVTDSVYRGLQRGTRELAIEYRGALDRLEVVGEYEVDCPTLVRYPMRLQMNVQLGPIGADLIMSVAAQRIPRVTLRLAMSLFAQQRVALELDSESLTSSRSSQEEVTDGDGSKVMSSAERAHRGVAGSAEAA
jgi:hypothetical protein